MKNDLLLIAMQEMYTEIKERRREWEKQGGREDQIDRSNYLDGFFHAWKIANRVHNKGAKSTEQQKANRLCTQPSRTDCHARNGMLRMNSVQCEVVEKEQDV